MTLFSNSTPMKSAASFTSMAFLPMKRCPLVVRPLSTPAKLKGITWSSARARIQRMGRAKRTPESFQYMLLGKVSPSMRPRSRSGRTLRVARPSSRTSALTYQTPFSSCLLKASTETPRLFAKPRAARVGFPSSS